MQGWACSLRWVWVIVYQAAQVPRTHCICKRYQYQAARNSYSDAPFIVPKIRVSTKVAQMEPTIGTDIE